MLSLQLAVSYQSINLLAEHGIAANDLQKLSEGGESEDCGLSSSWRRRRREEFVERLIVVLF